MTSDIAHSRRPATSDLGSLSGAKQTSKFVLGVIDWSNSRLSSSSDPTHSFSLRSGERPSGVLGSRSNPDRFRSETGNRNRGRREPACKEEVSARIALEMSSCSGGLDQKQLSSASWRLLPTSTGPQDVENREFVKIPERELLAIPGARSGTLT
jgi:hypothetical protein